jgi:hypothetical protein
MHTSHQLPVLGFAFSCALLLSPAAKAVSLVEFNFENFSLGQTTGNASLVESGISSSFSNPNNGVENFGAPFNKLQLTRSAGFGTYPSLTFTNTDPISLDQISFLHISNHNNSATRPSYPVNLQFLSGSSNTTLASFVARTGGYLSQTITGPGLLSPGTYSLRWVPQIGSTGGDFIGFDNIVLSGQVQQLQQQPVPGPLPVLGMGVAYRFSRTLRKRIGSVQGKQGAAV